MWVLTSETSSQPGSCAGAAPGGTTSHDASEGSRKVSAAGNSLIAKPAVWAYVRCNSSIVSNMSKHLSSRLLKPQPHRCLPIHSEPSRSYRGIRGVAGQILILEGLEVVGVGFGLMAVQLHKARGLVPNGLTDRAVPPDRGFGL